MNCVIALWDVALSALCNTMLQVCEAEQLVLFSAE